MTQHRDHLLSCQAEVKRMLADMDPDSINAMSLQIHLDAITEELEAMTDKPKASHLPSGVMGVHAQYLAVWHHMAPFRLRRAEQSPEDARDERTLMIAIATAFVKSGLDDDEPLSPQEFYLAADAIAHDLHAKDEEAP